MKARIFKTIVVLAVLSLACSCPSLTLPGVRQLQATPSPTPGTSGGAPAFGEMVFCTQVDENSGTAVDPATQFPAGTMSVTVVFDYQNMTNGQDWSLRMFNGERKLQGSNHEKWADGESGWVSYELSEDLSANPLAGEYTVQLYIGDKMAQEASFRVAAPSVTRPGSPSILEVLQDLAVLHVVEVAVETCYGERIRMGLVHDQQVVCQCFHPAGGVRGAHGDRHGQGGGFLVPHHLD